LENKVLAQYGLVISRILIFNYTRDQSLRLIYTEDRVQDVACITNIEVILILRVSQGLYLRFDITQDQLNEMLGEEVLGHLLAIRDGVTLCDDILYQRGAIQQNLRITILSLVYIWISSVFIHSVYNDIDYLVFDKGRVDFFAIELGRFITQKKKKQFVY
jgi:hypothetical protein